MSIISNLNSGDQGKRDGAWFAVGAVILGLVVASHLTYKVRSMLHNPTLKDDFKTVIDPVLAGDNDPETRPASLAITERNRMEMTDWSADN